MSEKIDRRSLATLRRPRHTGSIDSPPHGVLLRLRFQPRSVLTDAVFEAIAVGNPELRLERTAEQELEIMSPAGGDSSEKNLDLTCQLANWTKKEGRGLGHGYDSSGGFVLPNGAIRNPDASWVAEDRWSSLTAAQRKKFLPLCPDFVAEIRSESDRPHRLRKKMQEYIDQGARLGWLIDPINGKVEVYRRGRPVEKRLRPGTLSGEEVLPGFVLDLSEILAPQAPGDAEPVPHPA